MKHAHYDLIIEWANGSEIEAFGLQGWELARNPSWGTNVKHRIKKEAKAFEQVALTAKYFFLTNTGKVAYEKDYGADIDKQRLTAANYYLTEEAAQIVVNHWLKTNWFVHKALEFAEGYEFDLNAYNCYVFLDQNNNWDYNYSKRNKMLTTIYMSETQANKFIEWLNKYAPDGELK